MAEVSDWSTLGLGRQVVLLVTVPRSQSGLLFHLRNGVHRGMRRLFSVGHVESELAILGGELVTWIGRGGVHRQRHGLNIVCDGIAGGQPRARR